MRKTKISQQGNIIIPPNHPNPPEKNELDVAEILAKHFQCDIEFLVPIDDYKRKSPDISMHNVQWEIKCPTGNSKSTIGAQFRRASKQSKYIIIDTRMTKLSYDSIAKNIKQELIKRIAIKKVLGPISKVSSTFLD